MESRLSDMAFALPEGLCPAPTRLLTTLCTSSSRGSDTLWPPRALYARGALTDMQAAYSHTENETLKAQISFIFE